jgi:uncharacterized membrane protein YeaQ/YmgE (transglycosylase-associated protein family)
MRRALIATLGLGAAGVVEAYFLSRILSHPASGGNVEPGAFASLVAWAALPLLAAAAAMWLAEHRGMPTPTSLVVAIGVVGPCMAGVALAQHSHATPGFLLVAFAVQVVCAIVAFIRLRRHAT